MPHEALPRVGDDARFVALPEIGNRPCVVVDGPDLPSSLLALSHWPAASTPPELAADTSTLIVERYLEAAPAGPAVELVTNNHFDEDGLLAIWLLLERPAAGDPRRARAIEAAEAGDFATWRDPWAARSALALMAMAERETTPFPAVRRALAPTAAVDPTGVVYEALLPRTGRVLDDPERYTRFWGPRWERVAADLDLLDAGAATIEDWPELDLAVVRAPRPLEPLAVHPRTDRMRILSALADGRLVLRYRYETWVRYVSRPLRPRADLAPCVPLLQEREDGLGRWRFEGVAPIMPALYAAGADGRPGPSRIEPEELIDLLAPTLAAA